MLELRPCVGEPELSDPKVAGEFAAEMATLGAQTQVPPWCGYVAWSGAVPQGFGGFKGAPEDGTVEIGYLTFPRFAGTGVATCVARELLAIARRGGVATVIAHTLPEANASSRVLEKAGFTRDGIGHDADVGEVWRWRATP